MQFLKELKQVALREKDDLSYLTDAQMQEIQKNIRDGAKDLGQLWTSALELVHKAYEVANIPRPEPEMGSAWEQYDENIQYAVEQLSKYRGLDGNWRMTSSTLREAMQKATKLKRYRVIVFDGNNESSRIHRAKNMDDIYDMVDEIYSKDYILKRADNAQSTTVTLWRNNIRSNKKIQIKKV